MPRAIGANSKLHMAVEAAYGTPPSGDWRLMPFVSCDLGAEQPFIDADVIGLAPNRDVAPPFRDIVTVQGQAVVPVDLEFIGDWLTLLLGPPTSSGADPDFENVFVSGASPLPSASIELAYPDVPNFDVIAGVRADTCEIDFSPSGAATATVGLIGQGSTRSAASSAGTPTTRDYVAFNKAQGAIRRNGALLAQITGGRLTYSNGAEIVRTIRDDLKIEGVDPGLARAARRITVTLHETYLALAKTPIQGSAGIEAAFEFRAAYNTSAGRMMTVTLRNGVESYV